MPRELMPREPASREFIPRQAASYEPAARAAATSKPHLVPRRSRTPTGRREPVAAAPPSSRRTGGLRPTGRSGAGRADAYFTARLMAGARARCAGPASRLAARGDASARRRCRSNASGWKASSRTPALRPCCRHPPEPGTALLSPAGAAVLRAGGPCPADTAAVRAGVPDSSGAGTETHAGGATAAAPAAQSEESNLAEMAQRLEAALRRPIKPVEPVPTPPPPGPRFTSAAGRRCRHLPPGRPQREVATPPHRRPPPASPPRRRSPRSRCRS